MKQKYICYCTLVVACFLISITACRKDNSYTNYQPVSSYKGSIQQYLASHADNFDSMLLVLKKAGLTKVLENDTVTFFAPTDQNLLAALNGYNTYRQANGLSPVTLNDIDSASWQVILGPYIVPGRWEMKDFMEQDGQVLSNIVLRNMHGKVIQQASSGVKNMGSGTLKFSHMNGSRFERDWLSTYVATSNINVDNGIVHVLEPGHVLGFNYFINKAKEKQNLYSENTAFASGSLTFPNTDSRIWTLRVKKLTAIDGNTIEAEAADLLESSYVMRLTIGANDSITLKPAPSSANQSIEPNGPCYFDPVGFTYRLNYRYMGADGYRVISETIKYIAQ
jgi:uncharacterized surface protein with fasciclin (FAS1) repeats